MVIVVCKKIEVRKNPSDGCRADVSRHEANVYLNASVSIQVGGTLVDSLR